MERSRPRLRNMKCFNQKKDIELPKEEKEEKIIAWKRNKRTTHDQEKE